MAAAMDQAAAAIARALEPVDGLPPSPPRDALRRALLAASGLMARHERSSVAAAIEWTRNAMHQSALLVSDGGADAGFIERAASAFNACLRAADRDPELERVVVPEARQKGGVPTATRLRPAILLPERAAFVRPSPLLTAPPVPANDAAPADEEDDTAPVAAAPADPERVPFDRSPERLEPPRPLVWIEPERGAPVSIAQFYADITATCADKIAMLARHRSELPSADRRDEELRILELADAAAVSGGDCIARVLAWWEAALESPDPWKAWATAFLLATLGGPDPLAAVAFALERLAPTAAAEGVLAAEALAVVPHPQLPLLARDLVCSPHPIARAVGVDVLARLQMLTVEDIARHLADVNVPVLAAAARAAARLDREDAAPLMAVLEAWLHFPDPTVAWPAARALLLWEHRAPYEQVRSGGRLAGILGPLAAEILVLAGDASDMGLLHTILRRSPPRREQLSALARFGHPGAWAYLLHQLENADRAPFAAEALATLFGPRVPEDDEESPAAWRSAVLARKLEPGVRYRAGEPWSPRVVAAECTSGRLSRYEMEKRVDELAVRVALGTRVDLRLWSPDAEPALAQWVAEANKRSASLPEGAW